MRTLNAGRRGTQTLGRLEAGMTARQYVSSSCIHSSVRAAWRNKTRQRAHRIASLDGWIKVGLHCHAALRDNNNIKQNN